MLEAALAADAAGAAAGDVGSGAGPGSGADAPGPARILWPRFGPLVRGAALALRDCVPPRARAALDASVTGAERAAAAAEDAAARAAAEAGAGGAQVASSSASAMASFLDGTEDEEDEDEEDEDEEDEDEGGEGRDGAGDSSRAPAPRRLPPSALAPGASPSATLARRRARTRRALADVVFSGLGWAAVAPVEVEGQRGWARTVALGAVRVRAARGVALHVRAPLLPFEASGTRPSDWREA
jgi:hypothetical protein